MKQKRIYYLDVLRCFACLCVMMIHTSENSIIVTHTFLSFSISAILDAFSRIGVPLFLMISGALFLDEAKDYSFEKMKKRILNLLLVFFVWSFIYSIYYDYLTIYKILHVPFSQFIIDFLTGINALWFLKCIIGLYLCVPILRLWIKKDNIIYVKYFLIISVILSMLLPTINFIGSKYYSIFNILDNDNISMLSNTTIYLTYFIMGWYLNNYSINHKKTLYIIGFISLILSATLFIYLSKITPDNKWIIELSSIFIFMQSIATFTFFQNRKYKKDNSFVKVIAKYSFGLYIVHPPILFFLYRLSVSVIPFIWKYYLIYLLYLYFGTFVLSFICVFILNKIPYIKKIVNH